MDINSLYSIFQKCQSVSIDTRKIQNGDLFFALKGDNFDGNKFAKSAIDKGAKYAVIDNPKYEIPGKTILCQDSLLCLQNLAREHRRQMDASIISITGTNGKTTSKELTHAVISSHYNCIATEGNLNNHIGVPLSLLRITKETEFAIIEMGANHPGEIKTLAEIAEPDFGMITNVGKAHLEGFGSFEGVKRTKAELYDFLRSNHGITFLNINNKHLLGMIGSQEIVTYALNSTAWCEANIIEEKRKVGLNWRCQENYGTFISALQGSYNAENMLLAVCVGNYFKVPSEKIDAAIANYQPSNKRSEIKKTKKNILFLDLYNANPSSMELAIKDFHSSTDKQILILGDMKELGDVSEEAHQEILDLIVSLNFEQVYLAGEEFYALREAYGFSFFPDTESLYNNLKESNINDQWIFIKGSRSMQLEKLIPLL